MKPARVLVVDDDAEVRDAIADALRPLGYEVLEAGSARDAIAIMGQQPADVVLLDIAMPDVGGVDALRTLKVVHPEVPIIMLTANMDPELARATLRIGAFDYIAKPYELERLRQVVAAAMAFGGS